MSVSWADFNQDGHADLYVGNMYSSAGNRITSQPQFQSAAPDETRRTFRYTARGNTLFENQGDATFHDVTDSAGVNMGRWAWASLFRDINNDSFVDILIGNGFLTRKNSKDL